MDMDALLDRLESALSEGELSDRSAERTVSDIAAIVADARYDSTNSCSCEAARGRYSTHLPTCPASGTPVVL